MGITPAEVFKLAKAAWDSPDQGIGSPYHPDMIALRERAFDMARLVETQHEEILRMRHAFSHMHINNPDSSGDACATCGLDLRNAVHIRRKPHDPRT